MKHPLLSILSLLAAVTQASAALMVHLPFDTDGTDVSGSKHHAQAHNGAEVEPRQFRLGGGSATFDGTAAYFVIPAFAPAVSNEPRSVSFWEYSEDASESSTSKIFLGWGDFRDELGVRFDVGLENLNPSQLRVEFNRRFVVSVGRSINLCDGRWHHVVVTYDSHRIAFYVDGRVHGNPIEVNAPLETSWNVVGTVIGAGVREAGGSVSGKPMRFFLGQLDDVGIWNTALSAEDVRLIHGLACVGDNDLRWLESARKLWQLPVGSATRINGNTWRRVTDLNGKNGDSMQVLKPNGAGSFIVLDDHGGGLQITPHWWEGRLPQSVGLSLVVMGGAGLMAWLVVRLRWQVQMRRLEAKERMEAERRRIAQDLHDDLGSRLTEMMMLGDLAKKEQMSQEALGEQLAAMTIKTREMVVALDETVWTANPVNDVLPRLADYFASYTQRFLSGKGIACRVEIMEGLPASPINAKVRHHLLMAVKEALNNAVKYSSANEIWLRIHCAGDDLCVTVEDNGRGFDLPTVKTGNGLTNLRARLHELGGQTDINTQPGKGTRVNFMLPLKRISN